MMQKLFALLVLFFLPISIFAFTVSERPTGFVQDYAGILTKEELTSLETKLEVFEKSTTNEIAVVTIPSLDGDVIENVAQDIFTKWGIGKKDKNNGVLLLISLADRKTRIQTGYGVEGELTDIGTSYIQSDFITPSFRAGDYNKGINDAVDQMISALTPGGTFVVPKDYGKSNINWDFLFWVFIIFFQIALSILARSKSWWGGGILGGIVGLVIWHFVISSILIALPTIVVLIVLGLLFDYMVSKSYSKARASGVYPWWIGRGGGGSGGGGFGGFGGGGSGGGGSSGSW